MPRAPRQSRRGSGTLLTDRPGGRMPHAAPAETLLVFDLDNTLVHSRIDFRAIRETIIAMLRQSGATDLTDEGLFRHAIPELIGFAERHDRAHGGAMAPEMWRIVL